MKTYKVIIRAIMTATQIIEVKADSKLEAIDKAKNEALQCDVWHFEDIEINEVEAEHVSLLGRS